MPFKFLYHNRIVVVIVYCNYDRRHSKYDKISVVSREKKPAKAAGGGATIRKKECSSS